jgi:hypothetical protein
MPGRFFEDVTVMEPLISKGSEGKVVQGCAIKRDSPGPGQESWVGRDTTLILGCHPDGSSKETEPSAADWTFLIDKRLKSTMDGALVLVGCDRLQGGLHSQRPGARAQVLVNDRVVDDVGLCVIPENHTDYFHRVSSQGIPDVRQIRYCETKYSFSVPADFLNNSDEGSVTSPVQTRVSLVLEKGVRWDIDYVVLAVKRTRRKLKSWVVAVLFTIVGAVAGLVLTELWNYVAGVIN